VKNAIHGWLSHDPSILTGPEEVCHLLGDPVSLFVTECN